MNTPPGIAKVEKSVESMLQSIQKQHLLPRQKDAFLCSARCCDTASSLQDVQSCVEQCSQVVAAAQRVVMTELQEFQERFQRCAQRCQDVAKDALPVSPTEKDHANATQKMYDCVETCANESLSKIPKMQQGIEAKMKKF